VSLSRFLSLRVSLGDFCGDPARLFLPFYSWNLQWLDFPPPQLREKERREREREREQESERLRERDRVQTAIKALLYSRRGMLSGWLTRDGEYYFAKNIPLNDRNLILLLPQPQRSAQ
jgi:hypothetical protein